ncbi:MAG: 30S ribosomal protein S6 [Candidatus Omnitrophica bacterium]|nr:30S ribosomal protein S6 [Candidatus Omnitrophota bacterium]MBU1127702.1 30S ribosomal protein S6 [Candidatus Omnitrophota bacterium]MBU1784259.1 30S ribosomal protein S6 [Candidatus Omnitrophota bacterium]MBU1851280.1 30S ribosomal protein S6 [Candidatus Omnitrophota bacterium]
MKKTRIYSGLFIVDPDREEGSEAIEKDIKAIITGNTGSVVGEKATVKKRLAFPMNKKEEGGYYEITFKAEPLAIEKITRLCKINTDILRTFIDVINA